MNRNQMLITLVAAMAAVAIMASSPSWAQQVPQAQPAQAQQDPSAFPRSPSAQQDVLDELAANPALAERFASASPGKSVPDGASAMQMRDDGEASLAIKRLQAPNMEIPKEQLADGRTTSPYGDTRDSTSAGTGISNANEEAQRRADCFDRSGGQQRVTPDCAVFGWVSPGWPGHEAPEGSLVQTAAPSPQAQGATDGAGRDTPQGGTNEATAPAGATPADVTTDAGSSTVSTVGAGTSGNANVEAATVGESAPMPGNAGVGSNTAANPGGESAEQTSSTMVGNSKSSREGRGIN